MPTRREPVMYCDRDGDRVEAPEGLGDLNGGPVTINFEGYSMEMILCSRHKAELREWVGDACVVTYTRTLAPSLEGKLRALPFKKT